MQHQRPGRLRRAAGRGQHRVAPTRSWCPPPFRASTASQVDDLRRNQIEPALRNGDWSGAAVAAANGLNKPPEFIGPDGAAGACSAVIVIAVVVLLIVMRRRARRRRAAALAAARRVDPTDAECAGRRAAAGPRRPVPVDGGGCRQRVAHQHQRARAGDRRVRRRADRNRSPRR